MSSVDSPPLAPAALSAAAPSESPLGTAPTVSIPEAPPIETAPAVAVPTSAAREAPLAENAAHKPQRGRPFELGQSGNPNGRPKGSRNRVTRAIEALIDGQGEALGAKAVEKALAGDPNMLRALLSTLVPTRRERTVEFELPKIESAADSVKASSAVLSACAAGELSPREASEIMGLISTHVRTMEVVELETRVAAPEKKQSPSEKKVGYERWRELHERRKTRGILIDEEDAEIHRLECEAMAGRSGEEGQKISAELIKESEPYLNELRARGVVFK
jgi:hypothetical protein